MSKQHSMIELKKHRPFNKEQLARFIRLVRQMMDIATGPDCEALDGEMKTAVYRDGEGMTLKYSMGTRYCCTCTQDEISRGACGGCKKSNQTWGAVRESATYRGEVENFTMGPKSASLRRKKKRAVK